MYGFAARCCQIMWRMPLCGVGCVCVSGFGWAPLLHCCPIYHVCIRDKVFFVSGRSPYQQTRLPQTNRRKINNRTPNLRTRLGKQTLNEFVGCCGHAHIIAAAVLHRLQPEQCHRGAVTARALKMLCGLRGCLCALCVILHHLIEITKKRTEYNVSQAQNNKKVLMHTDC